jgi:hypothetical protein
MHITLSGKEDTIVQIPFTLRNEDPRALCEVLTAIRVVSERLYLIDTNFGKPHCPVSRTVSHILKLEHPTVGGGRICP